MSEAETLFGDAHVQRYRETDGEVGHIWRRGAKTLLLTTTGRRTGKPTTTPLIYAEADGVFVVVASKGARRLILAGTRTSRRTPTCRCR